MSLALEVRQAELLIVDRQGDEVRGAMFLHTVGDGGVRPETVGERLNDLATRFVPIRFESGVELVHLDWIAYVTLAGRPSEVAARDAIGAMHVGVELDLVSGDRLVGELVYARPAGSSRVSDLLNGKGEKFLMLLTDEETLFVNRDAICRARTR
jgi:hypothetical protein